MKGKNIVKRNPLKQLVGLGQSVWLDYIRRDLIVSGELKRLIESDGLCGMTSNPAIFEKAIAESKEYDADIHSLASEGMDATAIYSAITIRDVRMAADEFRSIDDATDGQDGYLSLEFNPHLEHDNRGTIEEAHRLWAALERPNVFIKVPATVEGLPAIRQLIAEGINVNVTLLFGLPRYREVAESYIAGLEARLAQGKELHRLASVASFFLSRIDTLIDPLLKKNIAQAGETADRAWQVLGQTAIASAKKAYQIYKELFRSPRFKKLIEQGAQPQRLLWASTGTKNPAYSDVKYVEELIGPETVSTVPVETLSAFRDHGSPKARLEHGLSEAAGTMERLSDAGIDIDAVILQLEEEGVEKFITPYDKLLEVLAKTVTGA